MRYGIAFILLLLWQQALSQVVLQGVVADAKSRAALSFVHIFRKDTIQHSFTGTVSSTDGRFRIVVPKEALGDSLEFSSLGYKRVKHRIASLRDTDTVLLQEAAVYLSSVTVTPLSAADLIRTAIDRIPGNYRNTAFLNTCFAWRALETDGVYRHMDETVATLYEEHTPTHSRYALLDDSTHSRTEAVPIIPLLDSVYKILYFDLARVGSGVMNGATLREWSMQYVYDASAPTSYWVIDATRKDHLQHARIFIDPDDYAFRKIEFGYRWKTPPHSRLNDTLYYALNSVRGTLLYEKTQHHYGIKYITLQARYTAGNTAFMKPHEPVTTNVMTLEYVVLNSKEVPAMRKPAAPAGHHFYRQPAAVDHEAYERIKAAMNRSKPGY